MAEARWRKALKDYAAESGLDPVGIWEPLNNLNQIIGTNRFLINEE